MPRPITSSSHASFLRLHWHKIRRALQPQRPEMWRLRSWEPNLLRSVKFQSQCLSSLCNPLGIPNSVIGKVGDNPKVQILNFAFANCSPFTVAVGGTEAAHFLRFFVIPGRPIHGIAAHQSPFGIETGKSNSLFHEKFSLFHLLKYRRRESANSPRLLG